MCHLPQLRYRRSGRTSLCSRRAFRSAKVLKLQKQTCQKLWPLRSLKFEARLLLPSFIFQNKIFLPGPPSADNVISVLKTIHREAPFRQLSKVADASQPLEFEKQSSLCVYRFSENRCIIKS